MEPCHHTTYRKVECLETSLFTGYRVNYPVQNRPEKFRGFREMHARFLDEHHINRQ